MVHALVSSGLPPSLRHDIYDIENIIIDLSIYRYVRALLQHPKTFLFGSFSYGQGAIMSLIDYLRLIKILEILCLFVIQTFTDDNLLLTCKWQTK